MMSNVLLLGSGGREHALAWKIAQSSYLSTLFVAPGNPGTSSVAQNVDLDPLNFEQVSAFCNENQIDYLVVGPEAPLVQGISNYMRSSNPEVCVIGPSQEGSMLEGSKDFCKRFLIKHNIPTAKYKSFTAETIEEGKTFLNTLKPPFVLKADGLAAGKGVIICSSLKEAEYTFESMLNGQFGGASQKVVIEEFLDGIEMSAFIITDGKRFKKLPEAKDYKRVGDGDTGPNTGGMGAVSPVPFADREFMMKVDERIIQPTVKGLEKDGIPYQGFLFIGLMNVAGEPYVIEFNVRLGDPETEVILLRLKSDLLDLFEGLHTQTLGERHVEFDEQAAATVVLVSEGYPGNYQKGKQISIGAACDATCFHAGTAIHDGNLVTAGGRVMAISAKGKNIREAVSKAYKKADSITYEGKQHRADIGKDLLTAPLRK